MPTSPETTPAGLTGDHMSELRWLAQDQHEEGHLGHAGRVAVSAVLREVDRLRSTERVLREEITRLRRSMGDAASRMHASLSHATEDALAKAGVALSKEDVDV